MMCGCDKCKINIFKSVLIKLGTKSWMFSWRIERINFISDLTINSILCIHYYVYYIAIF